MHRGITGRCHSNIDQGFEMRPLLSTSPFLPTTSEPRSGTLLSNVDLAFYRVRVPGTPTKDNLTSRPTDFIFSALDELVLCQGDAAEIGQWAHTVASGSDLVIEAINVRLIGTIRVPGGSITLRCKSLEVGAEGAMIDVSPDPDALPPDHAAVWVTVKEKQFHWTSFPPYQVMSLDGSFGGNGLDGDVLARALRTGEDMSPALKAALDAAAMSRLPVGAEGLPGGSLSLVASRVHIAKGKGLRLVARGGAGHGGCVGQSVHAMSAEPGMFGHAAPPRPRPGTGGRGGPGGKGGTILTRWGEVTGVVKVENRAGPEGKSGEPGRYFDHTGAIRPELGGDPAPSAEPPEGGRIERISPASIGTEPWSALFLRKAIQTAVRRYLMDPLTAKPDGSPVFPHSWKANGELLGWLEHILAPFADTPMSAPLETRRKAALYRQVGALLRRHNQVQTYFGEDVNAVPMLSWSTLKDAFDRAMARTTDLEQHVRALAAEELAVDKAVAARDAAMAAVKANLAVNETTVKGCMAELPTLESAARMADRAFEAQADVLKQTLKEFKTKVEHHFSQCTLSSVIDAAAQCLFVEAGGPVSIALMGALQGGKLIESSLNTLTDDAGKTVQKGMVITKVSAVDTDLAGAARKELFTGNPPALTDTTRHLLSDIGLLQKEVDSLTQALGKDAVGKVDTAIAAFRRALLDKGTARMLYTNAVLRLVQATAAAQEARERQTLLADKPSLTTPEWMDAAGYVGELYHQNVVQLLEMSDKVRRKMSYLTLGAAAPALDASNPALWLSGGQSQQGSVENIKEQFAQSLDAIDAYREGQPSALRPIPESARQRGVLVARIDKGPLLDAFRQTGVLSFHASPSPSSDPSVVVVENASFFRNMRVTHVQPRVIGARTAASEDPNTCGGAHLHVGIRSAGQSAIQDGWGTAHVFRHPVRETGITHQVVTLADALDNSDLGAGDTGNLKDPFLDAIGLFGQWTLTVSEDPSATDMNSGLDLKDVSAVLVYFRVIAQSTGTRFA